ncbi:N-acetylmuramoyl-L-alanine amidase [Haloechinothrix salitolerans]|uniref:N-acetylmuramoyl-L-alanine amidase n=1 Tax=Haloechinothrix salitolerans TaxID=926830 RepID=A0ABW2BV33_9PSEU
MAPGFRRRTLLGAGLAATVTGGLTARTARATSSGHITEPTIYGTAEWEARPPSADIVVVDHPPTYIVVHHTVEPGNTDDLSREHAFEISRAIQNFHMDSRGWIDTGQQFTISRGGHITEGRHRSLEILREGTRHVEGTNVANFNSRVIGIENEGLYTEEDVPDMLWDSLANLVTYMAYQYDVSPRLIMGHRDFNSTQCPGDVLYERLIELRGTVAARLGTPLPPSTPEWPLLRPGDEGERVLIAQRLLRERGARVPVNGVFGPATRDAVTDMATAHGLDKPSCAACAHIDERGFLGADIWPLLIGPERASAEWKRRLAATR